VCILLLYIAYGRGGSRNFKRERDGSVMEKMSAERSVSRTFFRLIFIFSILQYFD